MTVTEPIRLSFEVGCAPERAFTLWTTRLSTWWPRDHVVGDGEVEIVFEGSVGGRIYQREPTGLEHQWGTVTGWEPPARVAYTWHLHADAADATHVEVRFVPLGAGTTRVEIHHSGWERLGQSASERRRRNRRGWESVIPSFTAAATMPLADSTHEAEATKGDA
jgi:uncharacterized protein YndB with AHSA1/START domain